MERNFIIKNQLGLHARAAAKLVQLSHNFNASLTIRYDGQEVDGKSILNILTLACPVGSDVLMRAEGPEAEQILEAIEGLIEEKFGEE
jgi:phosphotransferase system HPr (HPr) family protein